MNKTIENFFQRKIITTITNKYNSNLKNFINNNPNINEFIKNSNLETIITHMKFNITNEEYLNIVNNIKNTIDLSNYEQNKSNIEANNITIQEENKLDKPKVKTKIINKKNIEGFVDTLILAFITTSFIGIILLNIYSKISSK